MMVIDKNNKIFLGLVGSLAVASVAHNKAAGKPPADLLDSTTSLIGSTKLGNVDRADGYSLGNGSFVVSTSTGKQVTYTFLDASSKDPSTPSAQFYGTQTDLFPKQGNENQSVIDFGNGIKGIINLGGVSAQPGLDLGSTPKATIVDVSTQRILGSFSLKDGTHPQLVNVKTSPDGKSGALYQVVEPTRDLNNSPNVPLKLDFLGKYGSSTTPMPSTLNVPGWTRVASTGKGIPQGSAYLDYTNYPGGWVGVSTNKPNTFGLPVQANLVPGMKNPDACNNSVERTVAYFSVDPNGKVTLDGVKKENLPQLSIDYTDMLLKAATKGKVGGLTAQKPSINNTTLYDFITDVLNSNGNFSLGREPAPEGFEAAVKVKIGSDGTILAIGTSDTSTAAFLFQTKEEK